MAERKRNVPGGKVVDVSIQQIDAAARRRAPVRRDRQIKNEKMLWFFVVDVKPMVLVLLESRRGIIEHIRELQKNRLPVISGIPVRRTALHLALRTCSLA